MSRAREGRAGGFSLGLVVGFLLLGYAVVRVLELSPGSSPAKGDVAERLSASPPPSLYARVGLGEAAILARLLPLHDEPVLQEFRAQALRRRFDLPEGRPWRLYLSLEEATSEPVVVRAARVDKALVPFAELVAERLAEPRGPDPVLALLSAAPGELEVGRARPMVLWGDLPSGVHELRLSSESGVAVAILETAEGASEPRWYAGQSPQQKASRSLADEVARLEAELNRERMRRAEHEQAFQEFSRLLGELPVGRALGLNVEPDPPAPPTPEEIERLALEARARERADELGRSLSVLMRLEGLRGLDLLESGTLLEGPPQGMGPVIFRCLDEGGLLTGSLSAKSLRLEASLAAHTLTLVLEEGFESRAGERVPFDHGVRRIALRDVDPEPWLRECPELFDPAERARLPDDGRWGIGEVRRELNRLLALDTSMGWYRLHSMGGVRGRVWMDVQLEELNASGRIQRRLFADQMSLSLEDGGSLVIELEDGAVTRGGEKQPFRDGRYRIVLPGVQAAVWRSAALPGFSEPPAREKEAEADPSGG